MSRYVCEIDEVQGLGSNCRFGFASSTVLGNCLILNVYN